MWKIREEAFESASLWSLQRKAPIKKLKKMGYIAKPKPNQSKAKGLVSTIKPILLSLLSLYSTLKLAVYSARAKTGAKAKDKLK